MQQKAGIPIVCGLLHAPIDVDSAVASETDRAVNDDHSASGKVMAYLGRLHRDEKTVILDDAAERGDICQLGSKGLARVDAHVLQFSISKVANAIGTEIAPGTVAGEGYAN